MSRFGRSVAILTIIVLAGCSASDDGSDGGDEIPSNAYCESASDWDPEWATMEQEVLTIVNMHRSQGANCGSKGGFAATSPLSMQSNLRCAARAHSEDMAVRDFFDHTNPSNEGPQVRINRAGYTGWQTWGENIAGGSPNAAGAMGQWMGSDGHCANIMNPDFTEIGVGYSLGGQYGHLWTQVFGAR